MNESCVIRTFRPDDLGPIVDFISQTLGVTGLTVNLFTRDFLLAPGFLADQLLVAESDATIAGFVLAPRHDEAGPAGSGWIAAFGVRPEYQRRGIATALVEAAIDGMRDEGVSRVVVSDVPVRYLLPGIDREAFPRAYRLLVHRFGFVEVDEVTSMAVDFTASYNPNVVADRAIRACQPGEYLPVKEFLLREFGADWWIFLQRSITARLSGDPAASEVICYWEDGVPQGVVHYRANRFGPLAVAASMRGRGIGRRLAYAALDRIRAHGFADSYFMIASNEVQPFYSRLGFRTWRRFTRLTKAL